VICERYTVSVSTGKSKQERKVAAVLKEVYKKHQQVKLFLDAIVPCLSTLKWVMLHNTLFNVKLSLTLKRLNTIM
jgi:hypothetical protein